MPTITKKSRAYMFTQHIVSHAVLHSEMVNALNFGTHHHNNRNHY